MACGTPVIATNIWGTPEVVSTPAAGMLMNARDGGSLAQSWNALFAATPPREATRAHAETFSWVATTQGQIDLFNSIVPTA
jgi:glycosyltransferase involved in cell wall biosynthesis